MPPGHSRKKSWIIIGSVFGAIVVLGLAAGLAAQGQQSASSLGQASTTPLGCPGLPGALAPEDTCAAQHVLSRLCRVTLDDLADRSGTASPDGTMITVTYGHSAVAEGRMDFRWLAGGGPFQGVGVTCYESRRVGVASAFLPAATWTMLTDPGSSDLLPTVLR